MAKYQGHRSWNAWNVSLWINNDEGLYLMAKEAIADAKHWGERREYAARTMLQQLLDCGMSQTPDGANYNVTCIVEAMRGM